MTTRKQKSRQANTWDELRQRILADLIAIGRVEAGK